MTQFLIGVGMIITAIVGFFIFHREDKPKNT
jgi:hypothetical protein